MLHGWLPTLPTKEGTTTNHPLCLRSDRISHLFSCHRYKSTREAFLISLQKELRRLHTHRDLYRFITHIAKYGESATLNFTTNKEYYFHLSQAYQQQQVIGLHMIWRGILSQRFGDIQENTYRVHQFDHKFNGTTWARTVARIFLTHFENLWEKRKSLLPEHQNLTGEKEYLQGKITFLMAQKPDIPDILKNFYNKGERLRTANNPKIKNLKRWLDVIKDVSTFKAFQENRDRSFGRDIRSFTAPQTESNPSDHTKSRKQIRAENSENLSRKRTRLRQTLLQSDYDHRKIRNYVESTSIREPNIA